MDEENKVVEKGQKKDSFFRRMLRFFRNLLIFTLIVFSCGYSVKLQYKLKEEREVTDSLKLVLSEYVSRLDSIKLMQDNEMLVKDALDDVVDKKLDEGVSAATISMDTTVDYETAKNAIDKYIGLEAWVDSLCASYPEGVAAHVKLHYLQSRATRLERLNHHLSTRFPEYQEEPSASEESSSSEVSSVSHEESDGE